MQTIVGLATFIHKDQKGKMMIKLEVKDNTIYSTASGKLIREDYDKMLPIVEDVLKKNEKPNWFFKVKDFEGWSLGSLWQEVKFDFKHLNDFHKIAIVGEQRWHDWMTQIMKPFSSADVRYFDLSEQEHAWDWIKHGHSKVAIQQH